MPLAFPLLLLCAFLGFAQEMPVVPNVEFQPLAAQTKRLIEALDMLGEPLAAADAKELNRLISLPKGGAKEALAIQNILDKHCLIDVHINPESRVKAAQGPVPAVLVQQGWRSFILKVRNEAGITPVLNATSPNGGMVPKEPQGSDNRRWMDLSMFGKQPMQERLSGLEVEYRLIQLYSRDAGKREAKLVFDVGQGTQDLGFRSEVDVLFTARPATKVAFRVMDFDDTPTTASFLIKDKFNRVYPAQAKRLAPDFFFHPQVYRANGEDILLPPGDYTIEYTRGPEYVRKRQNLKVESQPLEITFRLERWIDPAKVGWYSGDHHIHAAGCAHYEKPTEGVYPQDMMRHVLGEDLKIGSVLTWGPNWYFQKTFFEGKDHKVSTQQNRIRYDVEVSGFPSSHTGHICLLGLHEQDYPNTKRIEDWPTYGIPILSWAKKQGAVTGYAHSGWGLSYKQEKLPSFEMPPFDGIGANEYIVSVTQNVIDFISTVDTPYVNELNIWYHTLNSGYRARISGETDFPCIYGDRVGLGRSYVRQTKLDYDDWVQGIREGRNYVSDGKSHLLNFKVNNVEMGTGDSELKLSAPGSVTATAQIAALLDSKPDETIRSKSYDQKPYWELERSRIGNTRTVPVELIVNGQAVAKQNIEADGKTRNITFTHNMTQSGWVAIRILPSSHTNPIFVTVAGKPIRQRSSIEWCLKAVDQCYQMKLPRIRLSEQNDMKAFYEAARQAYRDRLKEAE